MTMEWPAEKDFDRGILDILENDVKGESLDHLRVIAMQIVLDGLRSVVRKGQPSEVHAIRHLLTKQLIDLLADGTEFARGKEIEIGDNAFYLLQDAMTNYFVIQQLTSQQKLVGSLATLVAIDTVKLSNIETKQGTSVQLGGDAMPDAPALFLENLRFITPQGKSHAFRPQLRVLVPLNLPSVHPRVAVPQESNASI